MASTISHEGLLHEVVQYGNVNHQFEDNHAIENQENIKDLTNGGEKIAWIDENEKLNFELEELNNILCDRNVSKLPVVIVSVNGRMRTGKSFLLNIIIKYLKYGSKTSKWIDMPMQSKFKWKSGRMGVTKGIQIWPEPFFQKEGNQKFAVILVDTQGIHDQTDLKNSLKLFGFSANMSSLMIYNDKVMTEDVFASIHEYVESTQEMECNSKVDNETKFSFGKLILLCRDWQDKHEYPYGLYSHNTEGQNLLDHLLHRPELNETAKKRRETLKQVFSDVFVYAMCGPGNDLPDDPGRELSDIWHPDFTKSLKDFTEKIFNPKFLLECQKEVYSNKLKASAYNKYLTKWAEHVERFQLDITDSTRFELHSQIYFEQLIKQSTEFYYYEMDQVIFKMKNPTRMKFLTFHDECVSEINNRWWNNSKLKAKKNAYFKECEEKIKLRKNELLVELRKMEKQRGKRKAKVGAATGSLGGAALGYLVLGEITVASIAVGSMGGVLLCGGLGYGAYKLIKVYIEDHQVKKL